MKKCLSLAVCLTVLLCVAEVSSAQEKYIITFGLKQSRISLDLWKHAKDAMNATEFQLPVDKEFFEAVTVGTEITDEFRTGSFLLKGSFSSWKIWVKAKKITK